MIDSEIVASNTIIKYDTIRRITSIEKLVIVNINLTICHLWNIKIISILSFMNQTFIVLELINHLFNFILHFTNLILRLVESKVYIK